MLLLLLLLLLLAGLLCLVLCFCLPLQLLRAGLVLLCSPTGRGAEHSQP
jgi:hypothetical protein